MKEELLTWKGRILERRGNHQQALKLYKQAFEIGKKLPNTKGRDFWVTSGYSAGKLLHWQHKDDEAKSYLKEAAESEVSSDYREEAQKLLSQID
nr:tetratricopeptide repeat protein [Fodinibius salsisoli]